MFGIIPTRSNQQKMSYNPFRDMEALERSFFSDPFSEFFHNEDLAEFKTDITDQGNDYLLEADLPGFAKEDVHLNLDGDTLTISAERHSEYEDKDKKGNYVRCERSFGSYSRSFDVSAVDTDRISAKMDNGVLKLTLPKKAEQTPTRRELVIE